MSARGEANKALIAFLANAFKVPKSAIEIVAGASARPKQIRRAGDVPCCRARSPICRDFHGMVYFLAPQQVGMAPDVAVTKPGTTKLHRDNRFPNQLRSSLSVTVRPSKRSLGQGCLAKLFVGVGDLAAAGIGVKLAGLLVVGKRPDHNRLEAKPCQFTPRGQK